MRLSFLKLSVLMFLSIMLMAASCGGDQVTPPTSLKDPTNFKATVVSETRVDLFWTGVSDATGYSLERKPEGGSYSVIAGSLAKTVTTYSDTTVEAGKSYSYLLKTIRDTQKSKGVEVAKVSLPVPGQSFNVTDLEPIWFSKQPTNGLPSAAELASPNVSKSGTSLTFTGAAEALYSLSGLCTKFSASVNGSGKVFADDVQIWPTNGSTSTGPTGDLALVGKQQLSLTSTGSVAWANVVVTCSSKPVAPNSAYIGGKWGSRFDWGKDTDGNPNTNNSLIATHAANLPDGRVVSWSAWDSLTFGIIAGERHDYSEGFVWNPKAGTGPSSFTEADDDGGGTLNQNLGHDMFCAGLAMSPDGLVIGIGGGTNASLRRVSFFDFRNSDWAHGPTISKDRWYPTAVALPDGRTFTALGDDSRDSAEILSANRSSWQQVGADDALDTLKPSQNDIEIGAFNTQEGWEFNEVDEWYPYLHVSPDGSLFQSGPIPRFNKISVSNAAITPVNTTIPNAQMRTWGNSVMFNEGKILVTGGSVVRGRDATKTAMVIDINGGGVNAQAIPDMRFKRSFQNSIVLPTGDVLIVGGNTTGKQMVDEGFAPDYDPTVPNDERNAKKKWVSDVSTQSVKIAEIYSPSKNNWRDMAKMDTSRNYHSVALLLEDGRVLTAGGGLCGRVCAANHPDGEIYEPAYLFNPDGSPANRPAIKSLSVATLGYGQQFTVTLSESTDISKFTMIKLSAVTHGINTDLRFVEYSLVKGNMTGSGTSYQLTTTSNPNVLTPGYYFLFALNDKGVPSLAKVVQVLQ
jgi:Domain of unknown function (DUF1929)